MEPNASPSASTFVRRDSDRGEPAAFEGGSSKAVGSPASMRARRAISASVAADIVERLARDGVTRVFSIPGGGSAGLEIALFDDERVEHIVCQHEATAGYMAIGHHLATGELGVVCVTSGPGILNVAPALAAARTDEAALLVLAGEVARPLSGRGTLQDGSDAGLNIVRAMEPLAGFVRSVEHSAQALPRLEECLQSCRRSPAGARGPALLRLPVDVQNAPSVPGRLALGRSAPPVACDASLDALAAAWRSARAPTLMVGLGCKRSGLDEEVRLFAEHVGAPVLTDAEALGVLPRSHPLCVGTFGIGDDGAGRRWLARPEADLVLCIGARLSDATTGCFSNDLGRKRILQLDYQEERLGRAFAVELAVHGELATALRALRARLSKPGSGELAALRREIEQVQTARAASPPLTAGPHDPRAVVASLARHFTGVTFLSDIGNHLLAVLDRYAPERSELLHYSQGLGGMGSGIGMGIGVARTRRTVVVAGDGGVLMSGNELFTAARDGLPLTLVVFVDGRFGMVVDGLQRVYGRSPRYEIGTFDFLLWARAHGVRAVRVESESDVAQAALYEGCQVLVVDVERDVAYTNPRDAAVHFEEART